MTSIIITTIFEQDIDIDFVLPGESCAGSWNGSMKIDFTGSGSFSDYIKPDNSVNKEKFAMDLLSGDIKILN